MRMERERRDRRDVLGGGSGGVGGGVAPERPTAMSKTVMFNLSKDEAFHHMKGFKVMHKRIRSNFKINANKEEIVYKRIADNRLLVFGGPRNKFKQTELDAIKKSVEVGGQSVLIMLGEGGESSWDTNINVLLEEYGMEIKSDAVVRTQYYKYFHPKECLVSNGVLNRGLAKAAGIIVADVNKSSTEEDAKNTQIESEFIYPFGASMNVVKPAFPILSTGSVAFPLNRPVMAFYHHKPSGGKIVAVGSCALFGDNYIEKEDNMKIFDAVFKYLTTEDVEINAVDADDPDLNDYNYIPDSKNMSDQLKVCLQEGEDISGDYKDLFDASMFVMDTASIPKTIAAFAELGVTHEPLRLITPNFETPLPRLQPAVFPPQFKELPAPGLDLFDLDEQFSSERVRLAQLTNKCTDDDLEYFVVECGEILGVNQKLPGDKKSGKHILEFIFAQVAEFKKLNQD